MEKEPIRILIADDNENVREFLGHMLQKRGFIIENACDGEEALKKTAQKKPDIMILDVMMPLMDGFETCKRLKENPDTRDIPIIFLSAEKRISKMITDMPGAAVKYIEKPCNIEYLVRQINELIL